MGGFIGEFYILVILICFGFRLPSPEYLRADRCIGFRYDVRHSDMEFDHIPFTDKKITFDHLPVKFP